MGRQTSPTPCRSGPFQGQRVPATGREFHRGALHPIRDAEVREPQPPEVIGGLACEERGVILVTGTTGSGKSTTLASVIDLVNRTASKHIVIIEAR